jgi:hypothetical protein
MPLNMLREWLDKKLNLDYLTWLVSTSSARRLVSTSRKAIDLRVHGRMNFQPNLYGHHQPCCRRLCTRSSQSYIPTPPSSREPGRNRTLAARKIKVNSNDRALLNFSIFVSETRRMCINTSQPYNLCYALQWKSCTLGIAQSLEFTASFLANM